MPGLAGSPAAGEHQGVHPIAQAAASASTSQDGPAVLVVLGIIAIWWLASHGKGEIKLRLLAWLLLPVIAWALVAAQNPAEGARIAGGAASGVSVAIGVVSRVVSGV
jgi:hypothetical protein